MSRRAIHVERICVHAKDDGHCCDVDQEAFEAAPARLSGVHLLLRAFELIECDGANVANAT